MRQPGQGRSEPTLKTIPFDIEHRGEGWLIATAGPVLVSEWREEATVERLGRLEAVQAKLLEQHTRIYVLTTLHKFDRPPEDVRDAAVRVSTRFASHLVAQAFVLPGAGLGAAVMRMVLAGIMLVSGNQAPTKVIGSIEEAVAFLASTDTGKPRLPDSSALIAAVTKHALRA